MLTFISLKEKRTHTPSESLKCTEIGPSVDTSIQFAVTNI